MSSEEDEEQFDKKRGECGATEDEGNDDEDDEDDDDNEEIDSKVAKKGRKVLSLQEL